MHHRRGSGVQVAQPSHRPSGRNLQQPRAQCAELMQDVGHRASWDIFQEYAQVPIPVLVAEVADDVWVPQGTADRHLHAQLVQIPGLLLARITLVLNWHHLDREDQPGIGVLRLKHGAVGAAAQLRALPPHTYLDVLVRVGVSAKPRWTRDCGGRLRRPRRRRHLCRRENGGSGRRGRLAPPPPPVQVDAIRPRVRGFHDVVVTIRVVNLWICDVQRGLVLHCKPVSLLRLAPPLAPHWILL
mmetsp:Transcript_69809/g.195679  ORF Transcript_69809/g.195679 Transcript_69809/m.195679 type:complete len:242 (-) Transcript_69809:411-1136(-)